MGDQPPDRGGPRALTRSVKRGGKVWIRIFPDKPVTKKPAETRMGKGKGNPGVLGGGGEAGRILYEMEGVTEDDGQGRLPTGRPEARHQDQVRVPHAGAVRRA